VNFRFSVVQLSVVEERNAQAVASAMELEATDWLRRYPVPVMVTAFSADGSVYSLAGIRPIDHLMAWRGPKDSQPILRWELVANEVLPDTALNREFVKKTFAHVPSKTGAEIRDEIAKDLAARKVGWWLVVVWL
jgi:hypothetical protein